MANLLLSPSFYFDQAVCYWIVFLLGQAVKWCLLVYTIGSFSLLLTFRKAAHHSAWWKWLLMAIFGCMMLLSVIVMMLHHQITPLSRFKVGEEEFDQTHKFVVPSCGLSCNTQKYTTVSSKINPLLPAAPNWDMDIFILIISQVFLCPTPMSKSLCHIVT